MRKEITDFPISFREIIIFSPRTPLSYVKIEESLKIKPEEKFILLLYRYLKAKRYYVHPHFKKYKIGEERKCIYFSGNTAVVNIIVKYENYNKP